MKIPISIVLVAVAALAATAGAQTSLERQLQVKDLAFRTTPGVTLRTRKLSESKTAFYLIASKASAAQVLQHIARVTGERLIAAPALENSAIKTFAANGFSLEDLIETTTSLYQLHSKEVVPGVRLFAPAPIEGASQDDYKDRLKLKVRDEQLGDFNRQAQLDKNADAMRAYRAEQDKLRDTPGYDPFVYPFGGVPQPDLKGWGSKAEPQPDWEKREFNGREFYYVPAPNDSKASK